MCCFQHIILYTFGMLGSSSLHDLFMYDFYVYIMYFYIGTRFSCG